MTHRAPLRMVQASNSNRRACVAVSGSISGVTPLGAAANLTGFRPIRPRFTAAVIAADKVRLLCRTVFGLYR